MALLMSLVALSIDIMLPALSNIGKDLHITNINDTQLIISSLFLGLAFGQLIFGPLSDSFGRKKSIIIGVSIFLVGCLLAQFSMNFETILIGRVIQGIGLGGPRIVSIALIRDQFKGKPMARIMSFIMMIFILVPMIAPAIGQLILIYSSWRSIFGVMLLLGLFSMTWFVIRQPETLLPENRTSFSLKVILNSVGQVFQNKTALGYTLAASFISGAFLAYLSSSQQIFQKLYSLDNLFPVVFAGLAFSIGISSYVNILFLKRTEMHKISKTALIVLSAISIAFIPIAMLFSGVPPLWVLLIYMTIALFCSGILFGNSSALAMESLGKFAGVGAAVVGSITTFISIPVGLIIARAFNDTVLPLIIGFAVCGLLSLLFMWWAIYHSDEEIQ